jgi:peroxiredoxin
MLELGTLAPEFELIDVVTGNEVILDHSSGEKALLVMFICAHCPYVKHINEGLAALGRDYAGEPVSMVAISSNDAENHHSDSPQGLKEQAELFGFNFPYLYDESQEVARAYRAACTPDFFLFDGEFRLVYRGQFDASRPGNGIPVTGKDLREAIDLVLAGEPVPTEQFASVGCNIKWKE